MLKIATDIFTYIHTVAHHTHIHTYTNTHIHTKTCIRVLTKCLKSPALEIFEVCATISCIAIAAKKHQANQDACETAGAVDALVSCATTYTQDAVLVSCIRAVKCITEGHDRNMAHLTRVMPKSLAKKWEKNHNNVDMKALFAKSVEHMAPQERAAHVKKMFTGGFKPQATGQVNSDPPSASGSQSTTKETCVLQQVIDQHAKEKLNEKCVQCGRSAEVCGLKHLMRCSACTIAPGYCGCECQRADWPVRRAECKANRKKSVI